MINDSNNSVTAGARGKGALRGAQRPAAHFTHRPRHASRSGRRAGVAALLAFAVLGTALPAAAQRPAAVSDVVVVPVPRSTRSLTVSWSAPDNAGKPAITGYDVRYADADETNWTTVRQDDAAHTSLIITGLIPNGYYDVQVRALNADGSGPWSSTAEGATSPDREGVYANHPLIPDDLGVGDAFRLLYITGDMNDEVVTPLTAATGTSIQDYHDFAVEPVLHIVEPGGLVSDWGPVSLWQTALVSMPGHDARLLTDTTWTSDDRGVPIYWLNGARVADDYADFYDGTWADEANPTNGIGEPHSLEGPAPWTGTDHDGTELFDGNASRAMGQATVGVGGLGSSAVGAGPLNGAAAFASTEERPLYGLWQVMVVGENLRLVTNFNQPGGASNDTRAAVRAQLFTTGPHSSGYGIARIRVAQGSETDDFLGTVAIHTTDGDGDPDLADGLHATLSLERSQDFNWNITAPAGTVFKPNTTYALVFKGDSGTYPELWTTPADGEDVPADGWSLANALVYYNGSAWEEYSNGRSVLIEMIGPALETEWPALVSATVGAAGNAVALVFDEDLDLPSNNADARRFLARLASAFAVTADGAGVAVSGLTASSADQLTLVLPGVIFQGQAVTLTYTDPTPGDDAVALQDILGNETPTFTTGRNGVPDVINNSAITVPVDLLVDFGTERHTTVKVLESPDVRHRFSVYLRTNRYGPPNNNWRQPVTIPLEVQHVGGAEEDVDYTPRIPSSLTFAAGQSQASFSMRAIPDGKRETGEGLRLDFGPLPSGVRKGAWGPYETIEFVDQVLPEYTVLFGAEAYTATEGGASAQVSIHLNEPVEIEPVEVRLLLEYRGGASEADHNISLPTVVTIPVGKQTATITVTATDDTADDDGESVTLSFVNDPNGRVRVGNGPSSATVALEDNDGAEQVTVSFGAATYTAGKSGLV